MADPLLLAGDLAVTAAAVGSVLFVLVYAALAPWYRSVVGWSVMVLTLALAASTGLVAAQRWFGTVWPGREVIRFAIFAAVACAVYGLLFTLLATQFRRPSGRRRRERS